MRSPKGARRNFEKLEERCLLASGLLREKVPEAEVSRRVGVRRQSVSRWAKQLAVGERKALKKAGRAERKPRLGIADLRSIERGLPLIPRILPTLISMTCTRLCNSFSASWGACAAE